jgi:hypothetical protein
MLGVHVRERALAELADAARRPARIDDVGVGHGEYLRFFDSLIKQLIEVKSKWQQVKGRGRRAVPPRPPVYDWVRLNE